MGWRRPSRVYSTEFKVRGTWPAFPPRGKAGALATGRCSVLPRESRIRASGRRARRQTDLSALESLEERTLLSFSTLGYSLPDLTITGRPGRGPRGGEPSTCRHTSRISVPAPRPSRCPAVAAEHTSDRLALLVDQFSRRPDSTVRSCSDQLPKSLKGAVAGDVQRPPLHRTASNSSAVRSHSRHVPRDLRERAVNSTSGSSPTRPTHFQEANIGTTI